MKHTKGPFWVTRRREFGGPEIMIDNGGAGFVAQVFLHPDGETKDEEQAMANARLFAAAPELLEALKQVEQVFNKKRDDIDAMQAFVMIERVRHLIAKAEGEQK